MAQGVGGSKTAGSGSLAEKFAVECVLDSDLQVMLSDSASLLREVGRLTMGHMKLGCFDAASERDLSGESISACGGGELRLRISQVVDN